MRLFFPLSGDDVFISYSRQDGSLYAAGLADALTRKKLSCFIDKLGTEPNEDLPESLKKKIRNCTVFVLIGTERAAQSIFVEKEILEFKKTGRTFLPVDFGGNVGKAIWYDQIPGLSAESERDLHALETGDPSENVVNFVEKSFNYTRRNQYMFRMFLGALCLFFILIGLGVGSYLFAMNRADKQTKKAEDATRLADEQTKRAEDATKLADEKDKLAQEKTKLADDATKKADDAQRLAGEKTKLAQEKTELAQQKTKEADAATKKAEEQTKKADEAEQKRLIAVAQEEKGRSTISRNYYNLAQTSALNDSLDAFLWAQKAMETAPKGDENLNIYKLWTLNRVNEIPKLIINPPRGTGRKVIYNSKNNRAITASQSGKVNVWNLETGQQLPNPLDNCQCRAAEMADDSYPKNTNNPDNKDNPIFSPDGKYVAALVRKRGSSDVDFRIWETETGVELKQSAIQPIMYNSSSSYFHFSPDGRFVLAGVSNQYGQVDIAVIRVADGKIVNSIYSQPFYYYSGENISKQSTYERSLSQTDLPLSKNPARNWIMTFEGDEKQQFAVIRDIETGAQQKEKIPLGETMEYINFTGGAGRVAMIFRQREICELTSGEKFNRDLRMITAWDIEEKKISAEPQRFATSINQEYKIMGFSKDDNRLIVDC